MRVAVLGSTGSIGVSTLDVLGRHPERFTVEVLAAATNDARLLEQCVRHRPRVAVLQSAAAAERLDAGLRAAGVATEVRCGAAALEDDLVRARAGFAQAGSLMRGDGNPDLAAMSDLAWAEEELVAALRRRG